MSSAARHVLHEALLWSAVALVGFGAFYFFDDLKSAFGPGTDSARPLAAWHQGATKSQGFAREVRLKADPRRHFVFEAAINDRPATFMADTGATLVVLTYEDAARLGLSPHRLDFTGLAETANGTARVAPVTLDRVRVDDITVRDVPAVVAEERCAWHQSARHELPEPPQELSDARQRAGPGAITVTELTRRSGCW